MARPELTRRPYHDAPHVDHRTFRSFDGTPIAYQVTGGGTRPVIVANGIGADYASFRYIIHRFWDRFRFYVWDYRGQNRSGRPLGGTHHLTVEHHARDALALVEHEGLGRPIALGYSMGVQVLLEATREEPGAFAGMVLLSGVPGRLYSTAFSTSLSAGVLPRVVGALSRADGVTQRLVRRTARTRALLPLARRAGLLHHSADLDVIHDVFHRLSLNDVRLFLETMQHLHDHDAYDVLHDVASPALLVAATEDRFVPLETLHKVRDALPDAELVLVPGGTHWAVLERPDVINRRIAAWLDRRRL
jgi:pimeloyl-ACP methyl ester carboxylesterase